MAAHAARIVEKACGNPLFLEEYSRHRNIRGKSLPSSVEDVLVDKATSLSKGLRGAIEALSLFPKPMPSKKQRARSRLWYFGPMDNWKSCSKQALSCRMAQTSGFVTTGFGKRCTRD